MPTNRISRYYPESPKSSGCHLPKADWQTLTRIDEPRAGEFFIDTHMIEDTYQSGYATGYADSESRYSASGIRAALCYVSLISGLVGFIVGALIAGML